MSKLLNGLVMDVRQVWRGLMNSRAFTAVAVLSLAIGIGANASIFSVIRTLLLDPMAVPAPEELSLVYWTQPGLSNLSSMNSSGHQAPGSTVSYRSNVSYPIYQSMRRAAPAGMELAAFNFLREVTVAIGEQPALMAGGALADGHYFSVLRPGMHLGRPIGIADDQAGAPLVAVLSHAFWQRAFGGDPSILGRQIRVNGINAQVVGVTAPEFRGLSKGGFFPQTDVTVPLSSVGELQPRWGDGTPLMASDRFHWLRVLVRQKEGTDTVAATAPLASVIPGHVQPFVTGETAPAQVMLMDASRGLDQTRPEMRRMLYVLMGVVGVVLLIACVNLAGLMLARGVARQQELAVRRALGASRVRLIRSLLVEGFILAIMGGVAGVLLTIWSSGLLANALTTGLATSPFGRQPLEVSVDLSLVATTFLLSLVAALFFSLLPAARLTRVSQATHLKQQGSQTAAPRMLLGRVLVAVQVGISVPLLLCALLLLRTVANLGAVDMGFQPEGISYFRLDMTATRLAEAEQRALYQQVLNAAQAVPGVTSVSSIENVFISGLTSNTNATINGQNKSIFTNAIGPGFFETMGMRVLAGRAPGLQDVAGAPPVGVLNETGARHLFGDGPAVGQTVPLGRRQVQIIGVVSDSLYDGQRAGVRPTLFDSALQRAGYTTHILVRSAAPVEQLAPELKRAVASVSLALPAPEVRSQLSQIEDRIGRERVFANLLTIFGGFALLLASIGLHGVTAYSVSRRTNEIGVRMALGAEPRQVLWLVQRQVAWLGLAGLVVGVPLGYLAAPLLSTLLFGIAPSDARTMVMAAAVMLSVALLAGYLPARKAARMNPLTALRRE
jgi:predicted permease